MPTRLKSRPVPAEQETKAKTMGVETDMGVKTITERDSNNLVHYYLRACERPHESIFSFEMQHPFEFLKCFGYNYEGPYYIALLIEAVGPELVQKYRSQSREYLFERVDATFHTLVSGDDGFEGWDIKLRVTEGEDPPTTLRRFRERLEFATGIKVDMSRIVFAPRTSAPPVSEEEVVSRAIQKRILFKIRPRPGYPQNGKWSFFDIVPRIAMVINRTGLFFPLEYRFRIWTTIWGTSRLVKDLIEANADFLGKAASLGVKEQVFDEVLNHQVPSNPATELIPLELLESTCLLRGLIGYMYEHELINDAAGYDLKLRDEYDGSAYYVILCL